MDVWERNPRLLQATMHIAWKALAAESRRGMCPSLLVFKLSCSLMPARGATGRCSRPVTAAYEDYFSQAVLSQYIANLFLLTRRNSEDFHIKTRQKTLHTNVGLS